MVEQNEEWPANTQTTTNEIYVGTVRLMLGIAPIVFDTPIFAMKGGTALNLFLQDMPRLSVDIDVVLTDRMLSRDDAIAAISSELERARERIEAEGHATKFSKAAPSGKAKGDEVKLTVISGDTSVKVEVNYVPRGTLLEPVARPPRTSGRRNVQHPHRRAHAS